MAKTRVPRYGRGVREGGPRASPRAVPSRGRGSTAGSDALPILDLSRGREHLEGVAARMEEIAGGKAAEGSLLAVFKGKILDLQRRLGFQILAIDSWGAVRCG